MTETCETCRFWKPIPGHVKGPCRRYPPTATEDNDFFPAAAATDWCGEYQSKPKTEDKTVTAPRQRYYFPMCPRKPAKRIGQ